MNNADKLRLCIYGCYLYFEEQLDYFKSCFCRKEKPKPWWEILV